MESRTMQGDKRWNPIDLLLLIIYRILTTNLEELKAWRLAVERWGHKDGERNKTKWTAKIRCDDAVISDLPNTRLTHGATKRDVLFFIWEVDGCAKLNYQAMSLDFLSGMHIYRSWIYRLIRPPLVWSRRWPLSPRARAGLFSRVFLAAKVGSFLCSDIGQHDGVLLCFWLLLSQRM